MARHDRTMSASSDAVPTEPSGAAKEPRGRKKVVLAVAALVVLGAVGWFGYEWWTVGSFMVDTDDAYVTADITLISSRVQGYAAAVEVQENQRVAAGDVLVRLEDGDYRNALDVARSREATASDTLARIDAQIEAARAGVVQAEAMRDVADAQLRTARTNAERVSQLNRDAIASQSQLDTATEALDTANASLAGADADILAAKAQVSVLEAQRAEAEGTRRELELAVNQASRDLDLTVLRAPADGMLAQLTLEVGDLVTPGARLAALVPTDTLYIEANFKETQLHGISEGAEALIAFDAFRCRVRGARRVGRARHRFGLLAATVGQRDRQLHQGGPARSRPHRRARRGAGQRPPARRPLGGGRDRQPDRERSGCCGPMKWTAAT